MEGDPKIKPQDEVEGKVAGAPETEARKDPDPKPPRPVRTYPPRPKR
jgi:hypothetical protein